MPVDDDTPPSQQGDLLLTAELLDGLLALIESGDIVADSAHGRQMVRRIEGAATALRVVSGQNQSNDVDPSS